MPKQRYFIASCPEAPRLQMASLTQPHFCPICQCRGMRTEKSVESTRWEEIVLITHS